jgi:hypothetical protein
MQPKAAKKIGGMTPKKMTGGTYGEPEDITLGKDYKVTKQIDVENGMMKICVASRMPKAEVKKEEGDMQEPTLALQAVEIGPQYFEEGVIPEGNALTQEVVDAAKERKQQQQGQQQQGQQQQGQQQQAGKKKRKSSKKRKSMKKGGMKRKSMKVKA